MFKSNRTNMKNIYSFVLFTLFLITFSIQGYTQSCTPASADNCADANVLCSLDEVNGYTCQNVDYSNPTACLGGGTSCPNGVPHNSSWWAFVTNGGFVSITVTFTNCVNNQGVQIGVVGACDCSGQISCNSNCSSGGSITISGNLAPCKTYYLWVDGCNGDVCTFSLSTSGGASPKLANFTLSRTGPNPVCKGCCADFMVTPQPGLCEPEYVWTIDGDEITSGPKEKVNLCFPEEGTFSVCVQAVIGNPSSGSICDELTKCMNVTVAKKQDEIAKPRIYCPEKLPVQWHCQSISGPGEYRCPFLINGCCEYDSVITIDEVTVQEGPEIWYVGCQGQPYRDPTTGASYGTCLNHEEIFLRGKSRPYGCDSSYYLNTFFPNFSPTWEFYCEAGCIVIKVNPKQIADDCGLDPQYQYAYEWYKKGGPNFSTDESICVDSADDYCVRIRVTTTLNTASRQCTFNFCESNDENRFKPKAVPISGDIDLCIGETGVYYLDTIINPIFKVTDYSWVVQGGGGVITTKKSNDSTRIEVKWNGPATTSAKVCLEVETECGPIPEVCVNVNIRPAPKPNAGPDLSVCARNNKFNATSTPGVNGSWTQVSGPGSSNFSDQNDAKSDVDVTAYGTYRYVWFETDRGCSGSDTVEYSFNEVPDKDAHTFICDPTNTKYKVSFKVTGGIRPYRIIQGGGTIDPLSDIYTSADIPNLIPTNIIIEDSKGCRFTFQSLNECKCNNNIGTFDITPIELCEDKSFDFLDVNNKLYDNSGELREFGDTLIFFVSTDPTDLLGTKVLNLTNTRISYDPTKYQYDRVYYIGATLGKSDLRGGIDGSKGCQRVAGQIPFTFHQIPSPLAGTDDKICGNTYTLNGTKTAAIPNSKLKWTLISSPGGAGIQFSNTDIEDPTINAGGVYGTFELELEETNFGCINTSRVKITFNPIPEVDNVIKICTDFKDPYPYKVEADIKSGTPPYTLLTPPGMIVGSKYFSDVLNSLDTFKILVEDANGCISQLTIDIHNCNCGLVDAGKLDSIETTVCDDQCIPINSVVTENLPTGKFVNYVLSDNQNWRTGIIERLSGPNACVTFQPSKGMVHNTTYYIIRYVGEDKDGDGLVDANDPCTRLTVQPVSWRPYPIADAGLPDSVCGLNYKFKANLTLGNGTWRALSQGAISDVNLPDADLTLSNYGTYSFEWTVANVTCVRKDTVSITFWDAPEFVDNSISFECDNTAENYRIVIDVRNGEQVSRRIDGRYNNNINALNGQWLDLDTWRSDWIPSGNNLSLDLDDRHSCLPDQFLFDHTCNCLTDIGNMDLTPVILCVDGTADVSKNYTGRASDLDGNDVKKFVLYSGQSNDPKSGTVIKFNDSGIFQFDPATMTLGVTYYIAVFIGNVDPVTGNVNFTDRCLKNTPGVPVTWYAYPKAAIDGPQLLNCLVQKITLNGANSTSGSSSPLNYKWSTANGLFVDPNATVSSTVEITGPGTYRLFVTDPVSGCTNEITYVVTQDIAKPAASTLPPLVLTCDRTTVTIDANASSKGADFLPLWTGPSIVSGINSYTPVVDQPGFYTLVVTNNANGCDQSVMVEVKQDIRQPIADVVQRGDLTCTIRQVQLDASGSTAPNGQIQSYTWSPAGSIISGNGTRQVVVGSEGSYDVIVKDPVNGCTSLKSIVIKEIGNPLNIVNLAGQNPKCYGEKNGLVEILDILDYNNQPLTNLEFSINGGPFVTSKNFPNLGEGTYTITVRDRNGCLKTGSVTLKEPGPLGIEVIKTIVVDQGSVINLDSLVRNVSGGTPGYKDYEWFDLNKQLATGNTYIADTAGDFTVTVYDQNDCSIREKVQIIVRITRDVWWPNVISANGDKINDKFNLFGKRVREISLLQIYDRWGELVYEGRALAPNDDKNYGWDGFFRNEKSLVGVYTFYAQVKFIGTSNTDEYKGDFTLLR